MARTNNLTDFLTDVADSIREKKGTSEPILASDFDTEIASIQSGGGEEYSITDCSYLFRGGARNNAFPYLKPHFSGIVTNCDYMFQYNSNVSSLELYFDTSNCTTMNSMFNGTSNLVTAPSYNTSNNKYFNTIFNGCTNLVNVPVYDMHSANNYGFNGMFTNCSALSDESLNNIMESLLTLPSNVPKANKTLKYIGLSSTQATICQSLSNYDALIEAGWTTGY